MYIHRIRIFVIRARSSVSTPKIEIASQSDMLKWSDKKWSTSETKGITLFSQQQSGHSHRLSGLSPFMLRWCLSCSQSKLVLSACFLSHQDRSSLLWPSAGLLVLGQRPNHALCCIAASSFTKFSIMHAAKFISNFRFMYAIRADSLSM